MTVSKRTRWTEVKISRARITITCLETYRQCEYIKISPAADVASRMNADLILTARGRFPARSIDVTGSLWP